MARYFFHLHESAGFLKDEEGLELPDGDAVRQEALKGARSILGHDVQSGSLDLRGRIEVADAHGRVVLVLPFHEAVQLKS